MPPDATSNRLPSDGGGHHWKRQHRSPPLSRDTSSERRIENRNDHQSSNSSSSTRGDGLRRSEGGSKRKSGSVDRSARNSSSQRRSRDSKMPPPSSGFVSSSSGTRNQDDRRERGGENSEQRQNLKTQPEVSSESRGKKRTQAEIAGDGGQSNAGNKRRDADAGKISAGSSGNSSSSSATSVHRRVNYNHSQTDSSTQNSSKTVQKMSTTAVKPTSGDTVDGVVEINGGRTARASAGIKLHRNGHATDVDGSAAAGTAAEGAAVAAPTLIRRLKQPPQSAQAVVAAPVPQKVRGSWKYMMPDEASRVLDDIMHEKTPSEMLYTSDSSALHLFERFDALMQSCVASVFNRQHFERDLKEVHYYIDYLRLKFRVNMRTAEVVKNAIDKNAEGTSLHTTNMKNADEQMIFLKQREEQLKQYEIWCQDYAKEKKLIDEEMSTEDAESQIMRVQEATEKAKLNIAKSKKKLQAMRMVAFLSQISSEILLRADADFSSPVAAGTNATPLAASAVSANESTTIADVLCNRSVSALLTLLPPGFVDTLIAREPVSTSVSSASVAPPADVTADSTEITTTSEEMPMVVV